MCAVKERKTYARCQACVKGALARKAPPRMCAVVCVCTHVHVRGCGCMCVWRVGQAAPCTPAGMAPCCGTCVFVFVWRAARAACRAHTPYTCVIVWDCVCMWLWLVQWRSPLPPAAALPPPPMAFRGTRALSAQSRGALTADSWPAGVVTIPSVCGTPPAGPARPHWRWAGGRGGGTARQRRDTASSCTAGEHENGPLHVRCGVCMHTRARARLWVNVVVACGPGGCTPAGMAPCCGTCVFVFFWRAARAACRAHTPYTCGTVWDCVCMWLWLVQWRSPLPPAAALPPPPSAFRVTRALSGQSRGALTADSWPAGVRTRPSVCGTPPAGRARPHWRWAGGRGEPPGRGVTQPPAARPARMCAGHCVCAVVCVCTHVHARVCG
jgi:hypothetical protein